ncbi:unnamed protein product [Danaus chrysippus]|uniref:(African queen) hypothetical protein n=1 Tax=Danaus chrysippus TaxID=151541 RepID=A0A8J2W2H7_9NEOP|nr:unnamed protein product [Danaus chrysippus]
MILFVSYLIESKRYVKDLKITLERQDNQVKNVVTLCMNTIKEMKTGQLLLDPQEERSLNALNRTYKLPEQVETSLNDSDSDEEVSVESGDVTVRASLCANMDWMSHTSETRQLLQPSFLEDQYHNKMCRRKKKVTNPRTKQKEVKVHNKRKYLPR